MTGTSAPVKGPLNAMANEVQGAFAELRADLKSVGHYLLQAEAHVYAFSIAANVLLAFFPFMLVMIAICRHVLQWPSAEVAIYLAIKDYFPGETGAFLAYNLNTQAAYSRRLEWVSLLLLLFTANGVFLPLEVALNRAWGATSNRSLVKNQLISTGLIFACGMLALLSAVMIGAGQVMWSFASGQGTQLLQEALTGYKRTQGAPILLAGLFKLASVPVTILILFLVYILLPNVKVPWRLLLPRAIIVGIFLEMMKWLNFLIWPWIFHKFQREYGPFVNSVTILTWSFFAGLVVLAGADWSARRARVAQALMIQATDGANRDRISSEGLSSNS